MDARTEAVRRFYDAAPFPGYPPRDSLQALRARADRNPFVRLLDEAIAGDARIVEVGCGTGQMCLYLARADRVVVGIDLSRAALRLGAEAARRFGLGGCGSSSPICATPACGPARSTSSIPPACCTTRPTRGRRSPGSRGWRAPAAPSCSASTTRSRACPRGCAARRPGSPASALVPFDPVLRDRAAEPARREAWLRDQYQHPEEHVHTLAEVQAWFAENGVEYLRAYPERRARRRARSALHAGARQLARGGVARAARLDAHPRPRRRPVLHDRAESVTERSSRLLESASRARRSHVGHPPRAHVRRCHVARRQHGRARLRGRVHPRYLLPAPRHQRRVAGVPGRLVRDACGPDLSLWLRPEQRCHRCAGDVEHEARARQPGARPMDLLRDHGRAHVDRRAVQRSRS